MKSWWRRVRPFFLSSLVYHVARLIGRSLRLKSVGFERYEKSGHAQIFCGWHGRSLIAANFLRNRGTWVIVSHSRDGEMQSRIFGRFGFQVIRGSTGRGGERALVDSIRTLRANGEMAITPDGPRGPTEVVQPGVLLMSKKTGAWLVPVGLSAKPAFFAKSWDRYMVPWFFSKAVFAFGEPVVVPSDATEEVIEEKRLELELSIKKVQAEADRLVGYQAAEA
ncbi:MAG: lysophospholipid acyltransferase family protein [Fimbriimonadaceae bacterium]